MIMGTYNAMNGIAALPASIITGFFVAAVWTNLLHLLRVVLLPY